MKLDLGTTYGSYHCNPGFSLVGPHNADVIWDLSITPYPWEDNSIEAIHSSHVIEHLNKQDGINMVKECYRILEPGGVLTLCCPGMDQYISRLLKNDFSDVRPHIITTLDTLVGELNHEEYHMSHRYLFNKDTIELWLLKAGFTNIIFHGHHDGPYRELFPSAYNGDFEEVSLYVTTIKGA